MTAPNIVSAVSVIGQTTTKRAGTSPVTLVSNSVNSNKLLKISSLMVANVAGTDSSITVTLTTSANSNPQTAAIANEIPVPAYATLVIINRNTPLYVQENATVDITAAHPNRLDVICAYEEVM